MSSSGSTACLAASAATSKRRSLTGLPTRRSSAAVARSGTGPTPPRATRAHVRRPEPLRPSTAATATSAKSPWRRATSRKLQPESTGGTVKETDVGYGIGQERQALADERMSKRVALAGERADGHAPTVRSADTLQLTDAVN